MGYIIPVNHYQYRQYAERAVMKGYDPYRFVPVNSIKPTNNPPAHPQPLSQKHIQNLNNASKKEHKSNCRRDQLYGELTGIGLLYNNYS